MNIKVCNQCKKEIEGKYYVVRMGEVVEDKEVPVMVTAVLHQCNTTVLKGNKLPTGPHEFCSVECIAKFFGGKKK